LKKGTPDRDAILKDFNANSKLNLRIEQGKYQKDDEAILEKATWEKGVYGPFKDDKNQVLILVNEVLAAGAKTLKEARGLITADYQNYLEKEWITALRKKYSFKANTELLKKIK